MSGLDWYSDSPPGKTPAVGPAYGSSAPPPPPPAMNTMNMLTPWACDTCNNTVESETVRAILKSLQSQTQGLQRDDIHSLKSILKVYSTRLHKKHTLVTEVKQLLVSGLGRLPGFTMEELSDTDLRLKLVCCQQLLSLLDIISPGLTLGRVVFI